MNARLFAVCGIVALLVVGSGGAVASEFGPGAGPGFGPDNAPGNGVGQGETPASAPDDGGEESTTDGPAFTSSPTTRTGADGPVAT